MLYCDLTIDDVLKWSSVPCMNRVSLQPNTYLGFAGVLFFDDALGETDPSYDELGGRYTLYYIPFSGPPVRIIPLLAEPSQELSLILDGQNCTLSIYDRTVTEETVGPVCSWDAPLALIGTDTGTITHAVTTTAPYGSYYTWTIHVPRQILEDPTSTIMFTGSTPITFAEGGIQRILNTPLSVESFEITSNTSPYSFYFFLYCDVYLSSGITRLTQRIDVSGSFEPTPPVPTAGFFAISLRRIPITARSTTKMFYSIIESTTDIYYWNGQDSFLWDSREDFFSLNRLSQSADTMYSIAQNTEPNYFEFTKKALSESDPYSGWSEVLTYADIWSFFTLEEPAMVYLCDLAVESDGTIFLYVMVRGDTAMQGVIYGKEGAFNVHETNDLIEDFQWAGPNQTIPGWVPSPTWVAADAEFHYYAGGSFYTLTLPTAEHAWWLESIRVVYADSTWFFFGTDVDGFSNTVKVYVLGDEDWEDITSNFPNINNADGDSKPQVTVLSDGRILIKSTTTKLEFMNPSTLALSDALVYVGGTWVYDGLPEVFTLGDVGIDIPSVKNMYELEPGSVLSARMV